MDHGRKNILCSLGPNFLSTHLTAYSYKKKKKKNQTETQYKSILTQAQKYLLLRTDPTIKKLGRSTK